jgi:hypothetical protein
VSARKALTSNLNHLAPLISSRPPRPRPSPGSAQKVQHELVEDVELGLVQPVELVDADLEVFGTVARVALVLGDKGSAPRFR